MRRAALATIVCAAPLVCAAAHASGGLLEAQTLREAAHHEVRPAAPGPVMPLPLPETRVPATTPASAAELASIARVRGPRRVLVGVREHADLARVARALRELGAAPEAFGPIGVLAANVPSGAALVRALDGDRRVAYIERDRRLRIAADPFDVPDPAHGGLKFTWFFDEVRAAAALSAAGGGSRRSIAVMDTGLDVSHPELAGRVAGTYDTRTGGRHVTDRVGHGTFVSGLIAAVDGNGIGGKGVAGNTRVFAIRGSRDGGFSETDLLRGIAFALKRGADVLNLSIAGDRVDSSVARALGLAFYNDVLPVAASGNRGEEGNPAQFPAVVLGGSRGASGIGLSVGATRPDGAPAGFSTHNEFVSLAAPGASGSDCRFGVFSTLPAAGGTDWDSPDSCSSVFGAPGAPRFAYGEGTSFSAPIVSGIAAVTWQVEPRLASEQVADVLIRSARQTLGTGWNEFTGAGIVDGGAAALLARRYDVTPPRARGRARRRGDRVRVSVARTRDRTESGREKAGAVRYSLFVSRDGGHRLKVVRNGRRRPLSLTMRLRGRRANVFLAMACDANGNCDLERLGRFRR